jgi:hypothetical protein
LDFHYLSQKQALIEKQERKKEQGSMKEGRLDGWAKKVVRRLVGRKAVLFRVESASEQETSKVSFGILEESKPEQVLL